GHGHASLARRLQFTAAIQLAGRLFSQSAQRQHDLILTGLTVAIKRPCFKVFVLMAVLASPA
ncbi:MAG: hypothetical protein PVH65_11475, partial [Chloroflexota bacterium]